MLAVNDTAAAVPALIGVQNDWRAALVGIGNKHVHLAYIHTRIASDAESGLKITGVFGVVMLGKALIFI